MAIKKIDLENPRSRSWVRSNFKVTTSFQHHIFSSFWFHVTPPSYCYDKAFFFKLTFEIQGQSHSSWSHTRYNILSTHILFVPCWSVLLFLRYSYFKIGPWKSKFNVMGEVKVPSHNMSLTYYRLASLSFHVNRASSSWDTTFSKFDLENQGSRSWMRSHFKVTMWV